MRKYKEKIMGGVFFHRCPYFNTCRIADMRIPFANGIPAMGKVGLFKFLCGY